MAKRFTDTEKWKDEWFLELEPLMKILWLYILDTCDHAGVWKVNFKLASYSIGTALDRQSAINALGTRINIISLDKWHVPKFITYQQKGLLNPANNAHRGVLNLLEYHNIQTSPYLVNANTPEGLVSDSLESLGAQVKVKVKVEVKDSSLPSSSSLKEECVKIDNVIQLFNDKCAGHGKISYCRGLSSKNIQDFITTVSFKEFKVIKTWSEIFQKTIESDFLTGQQEDSDFVATLNWLVVHDNALKVLNGQFGTRKSKNATSSKYGQHTITPLTNEETALLKAAGQI